MKKKLIASIILSLVLSISLVRAEVNQSTINYLVNQPQNQWITMALSASNYGDPDLSYIANLSLSTANDYSKTILALTSVNENPYNYNSLNYLINLENFVNNNQIGETTLISDDFWGIMAFRSAGYDTNNTIIQNSKSYILDSQNVDGGFSYALGNESDTNDTAAAIMALLDAGLTISSSEIPNFPYNLGGVSDSGSDAWVMAAFNKAGINPNSWQQGENTLFDHLETLYLEDGSYKWVSEDSSGSSMMTAYVALALSNGTYPVNYYTPLNIIQETVSLRIEGSNETICETQVEASNALEVIVNAASICGYTYNIQETEYGPYLNMINGEEASGMLGWLYRVNWLSPAVGANDYELANGDQVLWYFGEWGMQPLRLILSNEQVELGEEVTALVEYFNDTNWLVANQATVIINNEVHLTDELGQVTLNLVSNGNYNIYADKDNFIRSNRAELSVGSSNNSQTVNLVVNVNNPGGPGDDNVISFVVDLANSNFGTLEPGEEAINLLSITNTGTLPLYLEASVTGDNLFQSNLYLNQELWESYSDNYGLGQTKEVELELQIPTNYQGNGLKQGDLIFWASGG